METKFLELFARTEQIQAAIELLLHLFFPADQLGGTFRIDDLHSFFRSTSILGLGNWSIVFENALSIDGNSLIGGTFFGEELLC